MSNSTRIGSNLRLLEDDVEELWYNLRPATISSRTLLLRTTPPGHAGTSYRLVVLVTNGPMMFEEMLLPIGLV